MQYDENAEKYGYEGEMTPLKCDKLTAYKGDVYIPVYGSIADADVYLKKDVDAAIAELKDVIHELQVDLEGAKATAYAESVDAGMEIRRLTRALWLSRAKRATEKADSFIDIKVTYNGVCNIDPSVYPQNNARRMLTCDEWLDVWTNVWKKCLKKAEEYNG